jgi:DNA-binding response OmpR family regulator
LEFNVAFHTLMKKVLILDDNADILELVHEVLEYEGFEVRSESKGRGFMDVLSAFKPDLLLLDYMVPDMSGEELCRQIKSHQDYQHLPVILFSAYIIKETDINHFGCDAIILKPFDLDHLVCKINELLAAIA